MRRFKLNRAKLFNANLGWFVGGYQQQAKTNVYFKSGTRIRFNNFGTETQLADLLATETTQGYGAAIRTISGNMYYGGGVITSGTVRTDTIYRIAPESATTAWTDFSNLVLPTQLMCSHSNEENIYWDAGILSVGLGYAITKIHDATGGNAAVVGTSVLVESASDMCASMWSTHAMICGGRITGNVSVDTVQKFHNASEASTVDFGNLTSIRSGQLGVASNEDITLIGGGYNDTDYVKTVEIKQNHLDDGGTALSLGEVFNAKKHSGAVNNQEVALFFCGQNGVAAYTGNYDFLAFATMSFTKVMLATNNAFKRNFYAVYSTET
jgi:hypothetical protein